MKTKVQLFLGAIAIALFGSFFVGGAAQADCATTPTAAVCAEELGASMKTELTPVLTKVAIVVVPLLALAIGIPLGFKLTRGSANKIRV